jgi:hypothetical protein
VPQYIFAPWHDFYTLVGTASATLVGLMFVAASVGTGVFTRERQVGLRTFLSPTVVAFSVVLAASLIGVLPVLNWGVPGFLLVCIGLLGVFYSWLVWRRMVRERIAQSIDLEDRIWYAVVPAVAYLLLALAGVALGIELEAACIVLAIGVCLLLLAGIRNAWDMMTWIILRRQE